MKNNLHFVALLPTAPTCHKVYVNANDIVTLASTVFYKYDELTAYPATAIDFVNGHSIIVQGDIDEITKKLEIVGTLNE